MGLLRPAYRCYQEEVRRVLTYLKHRLTSSGVSIYTIIMGKLITVDELQKTAIWYFEDAYYHSSGNKYAFAWPNPTFPYTVAIHSDDLRDRNDIRISIRRWIETNFTETVIVHHLDKSYRRYTKKDDWESSYEVSNMWTVFYFEEETAATMFALRFSEYVKPVTDEHPEWIK